MSEKEMERGRLQLRAQPSDVGESVQRQASEMKEQALETGGEKLRSQVDERSTQIGRQAKNLAQVLRRSGAELGAQGNGSTARITSQAAQRLERVGSYLEQARGDDLVRDAERFARKRPWLVAGAAAVAGLVASRFLKASSEGRYASAPRTSRTHETWEPTRVGEPIASSEYTPATASVGAAASSVPAH